MICLSGCEMFEQKEDIFIMFTNDVASEVQGEIGYAGVKGYKDYLSSENSYVTLVDDTKDLFQSSFPSPPLGVTGIAHEKNVSSFLSHTLVVPL